MRKISSIVLAIAVLMMTFVGVGCRPYQVPIIEEIQNNETAFLVALEGSETGAKFDSIGAIEKAKVATKRVTIPTRWLQEGRIYSDGRWIPTAKLIKVDRTPVARRWTTDSESGTSAKNQALKAESKDSIGVSSGFAIMAAIDEADTAKYLYRYPGKNLADIMDNQMFNDCQSIYSEICAKYEVRELRFHKDAISIVMRDRLIPKYKEDGITISATMGLVGGLVYENKEIQTAIDDVFIAQTMKAKKEAELDSKNKDNEISLAVEQNDAAKRKVKADAEAYEIMAKAKAVATGGENYLKVKTLEVMLEALQKWDGGLPATLVAGGGNVLEHLLIPTDQVQKSVTPAVLGAVPAPAK